MGCCKDVWIEGTGAQRHSLDMKNIRKMQDAGEYLGVACGFVHDQIESFQAPKGRQLLLHLQGSSSSLTTVYIAITVACKQV